MSKTKALNKKQVRIVGAGDGTFKVYRILHEAGRLRYTLLQKQVPDRPKALRVRRLENRKEL